MINLVYYNCCILRIVLSRLTLELVILKSCITRCQKWSRIKAWI